MTFLDAVVIKGENKNFSVSIETTEDNGNTFTPLDLTNFAVRFRVLGAPTSDAKVLVEHIITQNSDMETEGVIDDPNNGQFIFAISAEETNKLGLGAFPISLSLLDATSLDYVFTLTEGAFNGEFSKIRIVQV